MDVKERLLKVLTANPETLKKIDDVLMGRDKPISRDLSQELRLITATEAAKRLGISSTTVWRMTKSGLLDIVDVNGKNRVTLRSVIELAKGMRKGTPESRSTPC